MAGTDGALGEILAGFSAVMFLVHPIQTEAVAYIASRSETLSVFFVFASFCVFLYRRSKEASWIDAVGILFFSVARSGQREHAIAPAGRLAAD